jgi:hypothetical protein
MLSATWLASKPLGMQPPKSAWELLLQRPSAKLSLQAAWAEGMKHMEHVEH